jgi:hypothetical protein
VVLATPDGRYAMGIFAEAPHRREITGPTYGRWRFEWAHVVKWNCVFRVQDTQEIPGGDYSWRMRVPFGTLAQVELMLRDWCDARNRS